MKTLKYLQTKILFPFTLMLIAFIIIQACSQEGKSDKAATQDCQGNKEMIAKVCNSGFPISHDTYNGVSVASDGKVYYVLCSESIDDGGKMYCYDPKTEQTSFVCDLTEASEEKGLKTLPQGKSHVNLIEMNKKLYFSTHIGYYSYVKGMEALGIPPEGYKPYPGGHLLEYDLKTGETKNLAVAPYQEGILTTNTDTVRGVIYSITWPTGYFFSYELNSKSLINYGPVSGKGESGRDGEFRTLCRSIAIDPRDGTVYFTNSEGSIFQHKYKSDGFEKIEGEDMVKDYFGLYDPTSPGHMGYNWRQTFWHPTENVIYGVHGNSGYLFRFDPSIPRLEVLERLTSMPSKRSGMYDQFSYGYLGFILGPDKETIYYLTGAPIYIDGKRLEGKKTTAMGEAKGLEDLHVITYNIPERKYCDHGAVFYPDGERPLYVNSLAVGKDGTVYTLARVPNKDHVRTDLVVIPPVR